MHKHLKSALALAVVVAALLAGNWALRSGNAARAQAGASAVSVAAGPVVLAPFSVTLNSVGTIRPWQSVVVRTRLDGEIKALHFAEGQDVKAGDLLIELDSRTIEAEVAAAQASKQNYEAQLKQASLDLDRSRRLAANGNAATQTVDQLLAKVEQLKAQVAGAEAQYQAAQVQLDYTRITAPIDGRVGLRRVDAGNQVRASDAAGIVTLNQIDPIAVLITLPQQELPRLQEALTHDAAIPVSVRSDMNGDDLATGQLSTLDNAIDEDTGTIAVKAMLANAAQKLWPGQAVLVRLTVATLPDRLQVPLEAVQRGPDSAFVYRITDGKAELVKIAATYQDETRAVIEGNIKAGDMVVTDGQLRLRPGSAVRLADAAQ